MREPCFFSTIAHKIRARVARGNSINIRTLAINDEYGVERVENHLICHSLVEFVREEWSFNAYSLL